MNLSSWTKGRVDEFFVLQRGFDITEAAAREGNIPVISSSGFSYFHSEAKVSGPGVVTGRKGRVGPVYYIEEDHWPHDTTLWVKDFKGNLPKYIYYFLQSIKLERYNEALAVPTLNRNNVHAIKCAFPPLKEQEKIVNAFSLWDNAIEKTEALIAAKEKQFEWLLGTLLSDGKKKKLDELFGNQLIIEKGKAISKSSVLNGNIPVVAGGQSYAYYHSSFTHQKPTITVSASGAYAGYLWLHHYPIWASDCNVIFTKTENIDYIYYALKHQQNKIYSLQSGGAQPHIYAKDLKNICIALPPLQIQTETADRLNLAQKEISLLKKTLEQYRSQKRGLMQKLLTGEWQVGSSQHLSEETCQELSKESVA